MQDYFYLLNLGVKTQRKSRKVLVVPIVKRESHQKEPRSVRKSICVEWDRLVIILHGHVSGLNHEQDVLLRGNVDPSVISILEFEESSRLERFDPASREGGARFGA